MTLDEVMWLSGRDLDAAVAERMGWQVLPPNGVHKETYCLGPSVATYLPHFSTDWPAAMQVREWAKQTATRREQFVAALLECLHARLGTLAVDIVLDAECEDYARAALLVEG